MNQVRANLVWYAKYVRNNLQENSMQKTKIL